jgi:hypothetical protein
LARTVEVGSALEVELDRGELLDRVGPHLVQTLDPVESVLDRNRDELFDLRRRIAERDRLHLDDRRSELREHVERSVARLQETEEENRSGSEDREPPEAEGASDYPAHSSVALMDAG